MPTIDSLDIQISAQANSANKAISTLSQNLTTLSRNLGRLNSGSLSNFSNAMKNLSDGMKNLQGVKAKDFTPIANGIKKFADIDAGKIFSASNAMKTLAGGLNAIGSVSFDASGISEITNAVSKLGKIGSGVAVPNFSSLSNELKKFVNEMNSVPPLSFDASGLSNLISTISKLGGKSAGQAVANLSSMSRDLRGFISGLNSIGSLNFDTKGLSELISGISRLGGKAAGRAVTNIPNLAAALKDLMKTLSTAPKVSQNLIDMTNALAKLARTGSSSGRAADSLSRSFSNLSHASVKTSKSLRGMQNNFRNLLRSILPFVGVFQLINFGKQAVEISSSLTEVQNVVDVTFGDMSERVEEFAKNSIQQFGMSELSAKQFASRFQAMGVAMGIPPESIESANKFLNGQTNGYVALGDSMADVSLNLTKLTADMASFYNVEQKLVAEDLEAILTGQTRPLRTYGLDLTQATLQEWAMKNGLDANIQSMSQAEKTMLRYQYVMANTGAAQGDFARTADTWANQTRILRQNLEQLASVIGETLINALKPFVQEMNVAMGHIIAFAQTVSNALGKIFGWKYEVGSGGITTDLETGENAAGGIASGMEDAAAAGKKLKDYTLAIDELNIARQDEETEGGAAGGAGLSGSEIGSAAGEGFGQWVRDEERLFESEIDTLYKLGSHIGDALSKALESINWNSVYKKAKNFGKGLADFLNGLISPRLFGNVGKTIASSLNTAIYSALSFGENFDFYNFGVSFATGINNFFETFDFNALAESLNIWVDGLKKTIKGFVDTITLGDIFSRLIELLRNLELDTTIALALGWEWLHGGKKILLSSLKSIFHKEIQTGIGEGKITLGKTIGLSLVTAITGFKIGNLLYDHIPSIQEWSDAMGRWVFGENFEKINISRVIMLTLGALTLSLGIAKITTIGMATFATNLGASIAGTIGTISLGKIMIGVAAVGLVSNFAFEVTKAIRNALTGEDFQLSLTETLAEIWRSILDGSWKRAIELWGEDISSYSENIFAEIYNEFFGENSLIADVLEDFGIHLSDFDVQTSEALYNFGTNFEETAVRTGEACQYMADENGRLIKKTQEVATQTEQQLSAVRRDWDTSGITIKTVVSGAAKLLETKFKGAYDTVNSQTRSWLGDLQGILDNADLKVKIAVEYGSVVAGGVVGAVSTTITQPRQYAVGGFPERASLFWANENGIPELVGRTGNQTMVANNDQILQGIEEAAYRGYMRAVQESGSGATESLLAEIAQNTRDVADKPILSDTDITLANRRGESRLGYRFSY